MEELALRFNDDLEFELKKVSRPQNKLLSSVTTLGLKQKILLFRGMAPQQ